MYNLFWFSGATRSHLDLFKKHRAERIDHYVIEVNKRLIRLEKVIKTKTKVDGLSCISVCIQIPVILKRCPGRICFLQLTSFDRTNMDAGKIRGGVQIILKKNTLS